jgi:hypothetical protein
MPRANAMANSAVVRIRRMFTPSSCHFAPPNRASGNGDYDQ